jgi:hypothetical protein
VSRTLVGGVLARTQLAGQAGSTRVTQAGPHDRLVALPTARGRAALSHADPGSRAGTREAVGDGTRRSHGRSAVESEAMRGGTSGERTATGGAVVGFGSVAISGTGYSASQAHVLCHIGVYLQPGIESR